MFFFVDKNIRYRYRYIPIVVFLGAVHKPTTSSQGRRLPGGCKKKYDYIVLFLLVANLWKKRELITINGCVLHGRRLMCISQKYCSKWTNYRKGFVFVVVFTKKKTSYHNSYNDICFESCAWAKTCPKHVRRFLECLCKNSWH